MADNLTIFNPALNHNAPDVFDGVNRMMLDLHVASGLRTKVAYTPDTSVTELSDDVKFFENNFYIPDGITEFSFTDNDILYTWTWNVGTSVWDETTATAVAYDPAPGPITEISDGVTHNGTHFIVPTGVTEFSFEDGDNYYVWTWNVDTWDSVQYEIVSYDAGGDAITNIDPATITYDADRFLVPTAASITSFTFDKGATAMEATFSVDTWSFAEFAASPEPTLTLTVKTDNTGTSLDTEFIIPTTTGTYNYNVEKYDSDGVTLLETLENQTGNVTLSWPTAGTYIAKIIAQPDGTGFPRIFFNNANDRLKLLNVHDGGAIAWTGMALAYYGCANLSDYTGTPDLSTVTNMQQTFHGATSFNGDISGWNVSNVTNMRRLFAGASSFNQNIGGWNVSNVTLMDFIFDEAAVFNADISGWTFSGGLTNMNSMFKGAAAFNADISGWDVSNVDSMSSMFQSAAAFNADISGWNVSGVTNMFSMFYNATTFNQNIGGWDVSNVTNMGWMFRAASAFNQDLSGWSVALISTAPAEFDTAATSWVLPDSRPVWGTTNFSYTPAPGPIDTISGGVTHDGTRFFVPDGVTSFTFNDNSVGKTATWNVGTSTWDIT